MTLTPRPRPGRTGRAVAAAARARGSRPRACSWPGRGSASSSAWETARVTSVRRSRPMPSSVVDDDPQHGAAVLDVDEDRAELVDERCHDLAHGVHDPHPRHLLSRSGSAAGRRPPQWRSGHGWAERKAWARAHATVSTLVLLERGVYQAGQGGPWRRPRRRRAPSPRAAGPVSTTGRPAPRPRGRRGRRGRCRRGAAGSGRSPTPGPAAPPPPRPPAATAMRANPEALASIASATSAARTVRASRNARASSSSAAWAASRATPTAPASGASVIWTLLRSSRRTSVTSPWARSRGPTSIRTGTPFSSQSVTRRPKLVPTRSSRRARMPAATGRRGWRRRRPPHAVAVADHADDGLDVGDGGRHPQAVVVAVGHDQPADHAGGRPPRGGPAVLQLARRRRGR